MSMIYINKCLIILITMIFFPVRRCVSRNKYNCWSYSVLKYLSESLTIHVVLKILKRLLQLLRFDNISVIDLIYIPEEVIFTVDLVSLREALFTEVSLAVRTPQTFRVPWTIQNLQDKPIQNRFTTTGTFRYGSWKKK